MPKLIVDPSLLEKLTRLTEPVEFCDEHGRTLGNYQPADEVKSGRPPRIKSPISDEELQQLRKQRTGRPLAEILQDLGAT